MSGLRLMSEEIAVLVDVSYGGRIQSVLDKVSGRELLYQRHAAPGPWTEYMPGCPGGWDDMFPNDAPWREHPEHGSLWCTPFSVEDRDNDLLVLRGSMSSPAVDVTREYTMLPPPRRGIRVITRLFAREETGPFLWSSHPMLNVEPGWKIAIGDSKIQADNDLPGRFRGGAVLSANERDRALVCPAAGEQWAEVLYARSTGRASVTTADGHAGSLLSWDSSLFPNLWIVTVTGELGIDLCVVLEPSTTRPYRLDDAIAAGEAAAMAQNATTTWWVELESLDLPAATSSALGLEVATDRAPYPHKDEPK